MVRVAILYLNPQSLNNDVPLPVGCHMFTQKENGELKIVQIPGILCSWLTSREKEFVLGL